MFINIVEEVLIAADVYRCFISPLEKLYSGQH